MEDDVERATNGHDEGEEEEGEVWTAVMGLRMWGPMRGDDGVDVDVDVDVW
ncbi:hypothetical protein WN943_006519 [Citrus x changshan-huyou]